MRVRMASPRLSWASSIFLLAAAVCASSVCLAEQLFRESPIRAIHMGGNWGTNTTQIDVLPQEYFDYLDELNVKWVGISVALHIDDSMDSTVELKYSGVDIPTFTDAQLTGAIQKFKQEGFKVYLTVAIDSENESGQAEHPVRRYELGGPYRHIYEPHIEPDFWPWRLDHPNHTSFALFTPRQNFEPVLLTQIPVPIQASAGSAHSRSDVP